MLSEGKIQKISVPAVTEEITQTINKQRLCGKRSESIVAIDVPKLDVSDHPAMVRISKGVTRNLGDFNSIRCDISIEMPCYPARSIILDTVKDMDEFIDGKLLKALNGCDSGDDIDKTLARETK